jgi:hypothetical protein
MSLNVAMKGDGIAPKKPDASLSRTAKSADVAKKPAVGKKKKAAAAAAKNLDAQRNW